MMWEPTAEIREAARAPSRAIGCKSGRRKERKVAPRLRDVGHENEGEDPGGRKRGQTGAKRGDNGATRGERDP